MDMLRAYPPYNASILKNECNITNKILKNQGGAWTCLRHNMEKHFKITAIPKKRTLHISKNGCSIYEHNT